VSCQGVTGFDSLHRYLKLKNVKVIVDTNEHGISFGRLESSALDACYVNATHRTWKPAIRWGSRKHRNHVCRGNVITNCYATKYALSGQYKARGIRHIA